MTTILFVHGTGTREPDYSDTFGRIKGEFYDRNPKLKVQRCYWGEPHGAALRHNGDSVPNYDTTLAIGDEPSGEDVELALWSMLYQDPLYELSALAAQAANKPAFSPGEEPPGEALDDRVRTFLISADLQKLLERGGIDTVFADARRQVVGSKPYRGTIALAAEPLAMYRRAIARSLIATAIALRTKQGGTPPIAYDAPTRDALTIELVDLFGGDQLGIGDWVGKQLLGMAQRLGAMDEVERRRGAITNAVFPFAGDILVYQGRGEAIRNYISEQINAANDSVVLLAHSLGGIACVDLLAKQPHPAVKLLVTAGSQAPFFYELGALQSLGLGQPLPDHFPPWLNFYDLHDFLSYIGEKIFVGRITDEKLDGRQPFPQAHGAYWFNAALYDTVLEHMKRHL